MRIFRFFITLTLLGGCLSGCSKKENESAFSGHPAQRYASRIAGSHRWTGEERDVLYGYHDIQKQLPDTMFIVSYANDTSVRVGTIEMAFNGVKSTQGGSPSIWFYGYETRASINHQLIYYPDGDSLQYLQTIASVNVHYTRRYSTK